MTTYSNKIILNTSFTGDVDSRTYIANSLITLNNKLSQDNMLQFVDMNASEILLTENINMLFMNTYIHGQQTIIKCLDTQYAFGCINENADIKLSDIFFNNVRVDFSAVNTLTLTNCTFKNCSLYLCALSQVYIDNCYFTNNDPIIIGSIGVNSIKSFIKNSIFLDDNAHCALKKTMTCIGSDFECGVKGVTQDLICNIDFLSCRLSDVFECDVSDQNNVNLNLYNTYIEYYTNPPPNKIASSVKEVDTKISEGDLLIVDIQRHLMIIYNHGFVPASRGRLDEAGWTQV